MMKSNSFKKVRNVGALMLLLQFSSASEVNNVVNISRQHITASELIKEIKKQTGYNVFYANQLINGGKTFSVNFKNETLENVLNTMKSNLDISFEISDKTIMLVGDLDKSKSSNNAKIQQSIRGKISDSNGQPLQGASVSIQGTSNATSTDVSGSFSLNNVKVGDKLVVKYIGYVEQVVAITNLATPINLSLSSEDNVIEDVVVTALGIKRQEKALSYNVQQVKSDDLTNVKSTNFTNNLVGKVAGLTVNSSSSGPGSATKVVMRGVKSIEQSSGALYVIDGVPLMSMTNTQGEGRFDSKGTTEGIADINPEDIESISVLTGAAAAALYGSAASNGAVLINTKKGSAGRVNVTLSTGAEYGNPFVLPQFQNKYGNDGRISSWGALLPESAEKYEVKDFFETASTYNNSVTFSGGSDRNQTYFSASSVNGKGIVPNNAYNRYNFTFRNTSTFFDDKLKVDGSASYIIQNHNNMINQGEYMNPLTSAYLLPRGDGLAKTKIFEIFDPNIQSYVQNWGDFTSANGLYNGMYAGEFTLQNPYWVAYRNLRPSNRNRYMLSLGATYELKKWSNTEKWDVSARIRTDQTNYTNEDKRYASTISVLNMSKTGYYNTSNGKESQTYMDVITNFVKNLGENKEYSLNVNLGASRQMLKMDELSYGGPLRENGVPNVFSAFNIDQSAQKTNAIPAGWAETLPAVFGSAELGYKNYLFLTVTGRNEWASQLYGENYKGKNSYFYPSVGATAVITDMMSSEARDNIKALSFLKLRSAYTKVSTPFQRWLVNPTYTFDLDTKSYRTTSYYPVSNMQPESTLSFEAGLSSRWFNNKLSFDLTYYKTNTKNQTTSTSISASSGYDRLYIQSGDVQNSGIELGLGYDLKSQGDLKYNTYFTLGYNKNIIKSLAENFLNPITGELETIPYLVKQSFGSLNYLLKEGGSMGDIYTNSDFMRNSDGNIYINEDGNMTFSNFDVEKGYMGSILPKYNLGWKNEFGYKGFSIGATLTARIGGVVNSMTEAALDYYGVSQSSADARDAGGVEVNGLMYNTQSYYETKGKNRLAQYYTYDATNVRLQEAFISYKIPRRVFKSIADATISVTGRNLWMIYNKAPFDPEVISGTGNFAQGLDYFMLPSLRSFGVNLKVNF
ncbi:SusC/RagA family TonB-linked outer membrane protein [Sphingobacterium bovistauri]|uniref:SusC/RagA family TonB-linked outer membrane protein n=1 Tax=Sphingobacterium bovistauri TaxID=2781959 RepID=A0ABS7Z8X4_9SPHI|nr:SusC/RagA family TonB-linked outer membrane protein [Sphingobacterium bovistauri]MCA5005320.1 SusC/RagA family TonB-linked outer membrane protein [Sphingobacterium bovistauri]